MKRVSLFLGIIVFQSIGFGQNPVIPVHKGITDGHIRVYDGVAYMTACHDKSIDNTWFDIDHWVGGKEKLAGFRFIFIQINVQKRNSTRVRHSFLIFFLIILQIRRMFYPQFFNLPISLFSLPFSMPTFRSPNSLRAFSTIAIISLTLSG